MAETVNGTVGVVWGLASGATGTGMGTFEPQSGTFDAESDEVEIKSKKGSTLTDIYYNFRHRYRLEVIPTGATIALARAANILPQPGAIITVTDTEDTEVSGTNSGKYILERASKAKSNTDASKLTFELKQWTENDVAVLVAAS